LEDGSQEEIKLSSLHQRSGQASKLEDLIDLEVLNDAELLYYIR
jgi:hypothetical protein